MLMEVKSHLRLMCTCFKYNLVRAMDNRISFIGQIIGMILNNGIMIVQWIVLFSIKDNIGGYGFREVLLLWGFASSTFGMAHTFFENTFNISQLIVGGKLDAFLVQPKDTLVYMGCSSSSISALGDMLYGFIILIILRVNLLTWLLFIVLMISGGLILASCSTIWHSLSFWFTNMEDFANIMNANMINMGTYPDGIFSKEMKWLFLTLLPVSFTVHIPIRIVSQLNIPLLILTLVVSISLTIVAYMVFNKGLKRYSSSNLMSARI